MIFVDSHVHIPLLNQAPAKVLNQCLEKNVKILLNVGYDFTSSCQSLDLSREHENIYASAGLHPHYVSEEQWDKLSNWYAQEQVNQNPRWMAWGEIGLDYVRSQIDRKVQQDFFDRQLCWAYEKKLPVLIHNREADQDVLHLITQYPGLKGVMHCYSSLDDTFADQVVSMGFLISFAGNLTYPASTHLRELVSRIPIESLLLETDAPYLSPIPYRGRENHPQNVVEMYNIVAKLRSIQVTELAQSLEKNFFHLVRSKGVGA
jgi:TatD DNase family protein